MDETRTITLWLDNEPATYWAIQQMTRDCIEAYDESAAYRLAGELREYVEQSVIGDEHFSGLMGDLLSHALGNADWQEMAEQYVSEYKLNPTP